VKPNGIVDENLSRRRWSQFVTASSALVAATLEDKIGWKASGAVLDLLV